ncbi:recombinase family protein [Clostridium botulinum]|uniref:recombinase family protein n=1 Tax=Clostridium botulinum TaxID=1491 RepID=UPI0022477D76|nr:recombinase family protein [Clostridium botulinum]UZP04426.1 recombinase family protein [Clostridium botulinum]UZP07838.1 recombinase family protein [Clostridium botulinum]UZP11165.1 recombinase family protein [Clostridium botulinum]
MKIALYVRVSTDEQESSIINQKNYIKSLYPNDEVIIYQDFGISGTKITGRDGFIQMMNDAGLKQHFINKKKFVFIADENKEPLFDKIVTKSITRFARNTDILSIWKELNQKGIYVHFTDINKDTSSAEDSLILNLLLTLSQEESKNISERTKFGNMATAKANKIRNNNLFGYHYIKDTNSLLINEDEAKVVRMMFDLCIKGYGYNKISELLANDGIFNKKGQPFAMGTIKNMIHNKKYCGYNVRNTWQSKNLFSENHTNVRRSKDEWIIQKNDRIQPIITEETFNLAHEQVNHRLLHGNTGKHTTKRDTRDKVICGCCGKSFYICHSRKIGSGINSHPYYICATKKKQGKGACNNNNVQVKKVDNFIDELKKNYYKNIRLKNKAELTKLKLKLKKCKNTSITEIKKEIEVLKVFIGKKEVELMDIMDDFSSKGDVIKRIANKKMDLISQEIEASENKILELDRSKNNLDNDKLDIQNKINVISRELKVVDTTELTREQLMDKIRFIKVNPNNKLVVEYY